MYEGTGAGSAQRDWVGVFGVSECGEGVSMYEGTGAGSAQRDVVGVLFVRGAGVSGWDSVVVMGARGAVASKVVSSSRSLGVPAGSGCGASSQVVGVVTEEVEVVGVWVGASGVVVEVVVVMLVVVVMIVGGVVVVVDVFVLAGVGVGVGVAGFELALASATISSQSIWIGGVIVVVVVG